MKDLSKLFGKLFGDNPFEQLNEDGMFNTDTDKLGEPTKVEKYTENGNEYTKSVWETEEGTITKIVSYHESYEDWLNYLMFASHEYDSPMTSEEKIDLLETKLQYCVDIENYERAARLRDEIKKLKNT